MSAAKRRRLPCHLLLHFLPPQCEQIASVTLLSFRHAQTLASFASFLLVYSSFSRRVCAYAESAMRVPTDARTGGGGERQTGRHTELTRKRGADRVCLLGRKQSFALLIQLADVCVCACMKRSVLPVATVAPPIPACVKQHGSAL